MHGLRIRRLMATAGSVKLDLVIAKTMPLLALTVMSRFLERPRQMCAASADDVADLCRQERHPVAYVLA